VIQDPTVNQHQHMIFPLTTAKANKLAPGFLVITRQPLLLEKCSNPLWIQQV